MNVRGLLGPQLQQLAAAEAELEAEVNAAIHREITLAFLYHRSVHTFGALVQGERIPPEDCLRAWAHLVVLIRGAFYWYDSGLSDEENECRREAALMQAEEPD